MASIDIAIENERISEAQDRVDRATRGPGDVGGSPTYSADQLANRDTVQTLAASAFEEPLTEQQRLIMEELVRAGANQETINQNLSSWGTGNAWPVADNIRPTLPAGQGTLAPGVAPLPNASTLPSLGTTIVQRGRSLAFDQDWEGGAMPPGRVIFTDIANRQRSGVRFGTLPMVVFQDEPVSPWTMGGNGWRVVEG